MHSNALPSDQMYLEKCLTCQFVYCLLKNSAVCDGNIQSVNKRRENVSSPNKTKPDTQPQCTFRLSESQSG